MLEVYKSSLFQQFLRLCCYAAWNVTIEAIVFLKKITRDLNSLFNSSNLVFPLKHIFGAKSELHQFSIYFVVVMRPTLIPITLAVRGTAPPCNLSVWEPRFGGFYMELGGLTGCKRDQQRLR